MEQGLKVAAWAVWPLRVEKGDGEGASSERSTLENARDGNLLHGESGSAISLAGAPGLPLASAAMEVPTSIAAP